MGIFALNHVQSTISNLSFFKQTTETQTQKPKTKQTSRNVTKPFAQPKSSAHAATQLQLQPSKADLANLQWEMSLRCAYSIDTDRCSCYDRKGIKANLELQRCKELATGKHNLIRY